MVKFILLSILFLVSAHSKASYFNPQFVDKKNYASGKQVCSEGEALTGGENGGFVQVPYDYSKPEETKASIYYHLNDPFDPSLPTMIFFNGGPGETSHFGLLSFNFGWNVVKFDQRGIACSRPDTFEAYRDPNFYSSENTARDALAIVKHLGLQKVSVYGISYGTVPATIFASLFPETTRAVVLEGVVYQGNDELWQAPHRRKILQRLINNLADEDKIRLANFGKKFSLPEEWFSMMARTIMMENESLDIIKEKILSIKDKDRELADMLKAVLESKTQPSTYPLLESDSTVYAMIGCKELSLGAPGSYPLDLLKQTTLVPGSESTSKYYCDPLKIRESKKYSALDYPVKVPITYFQGALDGATQAPFAVWHYKYVAKGPAQLLIMPKGGHNPSLSLLYHSSMVQLELLRAGLEGKAVTREQIQDVQQVDQLFWAKAAKQGL